MKKILVLGSMLFALNGFSQSFMILNNGVTLTTDKAAFIYDFGHFIVPYKVSLTAGQFLVEDEKLVTIDEKGFLYRKDEKAPSKIKGKGSKYLISDSGTLYTFDASGFFYKYDKDSALKKAVKFGGNFFTVKPDNKKPLIDLYTVNSKGNYFKMNVAGLNPADITVMGGSFFQTNKGVIFTVNKDGFVISKADMKVGTIKKSGGNYFIDANNAIYTVSEEGFLYIPNLPAGLKVDSISKLGQNYFLDSEGKLFTVDNTGAIFEREMKSHDLREAKLLSL